MIRKYFIPLLSVALVACISSSCKKDIPVTLETKELTMGSISQSVTATGTVESKTSVDVGTQVTGIIDKLYVDYNDEVKAGQLIAEIEKTLLQSELNSADATLESTRLTYEFNKRNYERDKALHEKQLISDYEFETSKNQYEVSKQNYSKAQSDRVRAAKNLNYAEIYSPIDGIVISREVEVGQTVVSSMNVANLYTIADLDNMRIVGNVDEADIGQVKVGQPVTFTVDAYPNDEFHGTVTQVRLNPTTESNVVTYEVIVDTPNPDRKLIPGLTANITIYTLLEKDILLAPTSAMRFSPQEFEKDKSLPKAAAPAPQLSDGEKCIWILRDNKLYPTPVKVGVSNGTNIQIVSGAKAGDVVATGYDAMMPGGMPGGPSAERSPFAPGPPGKKK